MRNKQMETDYLEFTKSLPVLAIRFFPFTIGIIQITIGNKRFADGF